MDIQSVLDKHKKDLINKSGVLSVGRGPNDTIHVLVYKDIKKEDETAIPQNLDGYKVVVRKVGQIKPR